jgi:O-antigen/teichoic acid export membrane protein
MISKLSVAIEPDAENSSTVVPSGIARLGLTANTVRVWGTRSALSLVDQGLTSAAGLVLNVFLARWMGAESYGAFAVAFAGCLFVSGFHNVLLLEPLSVIGPARYTSQMGAYFRAQLSIHAILMWPLSAAVLLAALMLSLVTPHSPLIGALLGGGLSLPFLLLLWLARRMCYAVHRPAVAVLGSSIYLLVVIVGLFLLWHLDRVSPLSAFLLAAAGSLLGACVLLFQLGVSHSASAMLDIPWRIVFRENWHYGRWLAGSAVLYSVSSQVQMFLVAAFLGLGSAGILRAMQIPMQFMAQIITATGMLLLPTFAYDFGKGRTERLRHKAALVSLGLSVMALCFVMLLALVSRPVEHLLFGSKYSAFAWLMPVLALVSVVNGFSTGYSMGMRGSQMPEFDLISNAVAAPIAVVSAYYFMRWWGLGGAAISIVLSFAVIAIVTFACFQRYMANPRVTVE